MELEVSQHVGAERYERTPERTGQRNGYREREWDTRVGTIELRVPRVRDGSYFPSLLEPRQRAERALVAVVQEAYVQGVSTRRVDELVQALGMDGISKSQVSRLCQELDAEVERFRTPAAGGAVPVRLAGRDVREGARRTGGWSRWRWSSPSASTATGAARGAGAGRRAERGRRLLAALPARRWWRAASAGVQLVISDAHQGLKGAIAAVLQGASWQRCRVHFVRNALALVPKTAAQHGRRHDPHRLRPARRRRRPRAVAPGRRRLPRPLPRAWPPCWTRPRPTCWPTSPSRREHWRQIWSNNPLERLNKEVKRRTDVVGIFPNDGGRRPPGRGGPAPSSTTSGRSPAATSAPSRWPSSERRPRNLSWLLLASVQEMRMAILEATVRPRSVPRPTA